jgi:hypothetical protein
MAWPFPTAGRPGVLRQANGRRPRKKSSILMRGRGPRYNGRTPWED